MAIPPGALTRETPLLATTLLRENEKRCRSELAAANQALDSLSRSLSHDLRALLRDALLIRDVSYQLLDNALKYSSRQATPSIRISGRIEGRETIYQVDDNGLGFDMPYVHKLFGIFQRLHSPEDFAGTGVGLAIVQSIIMRHGGRVWTQSAPDAGASFHFSLPIVHTVAEGVETQEQLDMLRGLGCDQAQGYVFAHPSPAADVPSVISQPQAL